MPIRVATRADHEAILKIARQHPCTRDFSNHMFSGEAAYEKGWIWVGEDYDGMTDEIVPWGFYCVRHKVRTPATSLYFIGVDERVRGRGAGARLLAHMEEHSPHPRVELNVANMNPRALSFYLARGYVIAGDALKGTGKALEKEWRR